MKRAERPRLKRLIDRMAGAAALMTALCLLSATLPGHVGDKTPITALARQFDSLAPWLLGLTLAFAAATALLGARLLSLALAVATLIAGTELYQSHRALSLPLVPGDPVDARVIFFNVLFENAAQSHRIVDAVVAADPDLVIFSEAEAMYPALPALRRHFGFVSDCTLDKCEMLVASRAPPNRFWRLSLNPIWPKRYAVTEVRARTGKPFHVAASHVAKPWFDGISDNEYARLSSQYDWLSLPVVAVGDFNAAPWSYPVQTLLRRTGFRAMRRPIASWPASAGDFGVPIDLALVHNGARIVHAVPFGTGLGSNHRGLLLDISLP